MFSTTNNCDATGWRSGASTLPEYPSITASLESDWLVVGAGFSGLAAARRLAEIRPDDRIVLVDSQNIGTGNSSRSSGFVVSLGHFDSNPAENQRLFRLGKNGCQILKKLITRHQIDCNWDDQGRIIAARGRAGLRTLATTKKTLDRVGSPIQELSSQQLFDATAMEGYLAGIRQLDSALVNPTMLLEGLARSLPSNVEVYGRSKVIQLSDIPNGVVANFENGQVTASNVLVTNNSAVGELKLGRGRVFPMRTFLSEARRHNAKNPSSELPYWGVTSVERVGSSLRKIDDRIFVRNTAFFGTKPAAAVAEEMKNVTRVHQRALQARFPNDKIEIANTWSGTVGVSANGAQIFGKAKDRVFISAGFNGHGIAQGTACGRLLVDLALDIESAELADAQALKSPNWIPHGQILRAGVHAYVNWLCFRFRDEI